jgi:hypothetical protein
MGMTRKQQSTGVIYIQPDGTAFASPDGIGRVFFENSVEAREETGLNRVIQLVEYPADED